MKKSFAPLVSDDTEILILGSMPGDASIAAGEYYAHPRNRFWKMMATLTGEPLPVSYEEKKDLLKRHKTGLWDLAKTAKRKGSLDTNISDATVNDIDGLLKDHPKIKAVGFNGGKAQTLFKANFRQREGINYIGLPSTSPANAGISFEQICEAWGKLLPPYASCRR
ncbi:MAG: DNA-deoxyinosine glycosylase [Tannerella sp.]|nr:DNA-deoxyinosine glycosylase [Tannerella sp.]